MNSVFSHRILCHPWVQCQEKGKGKENENEKNFEHQIYLHMAVMMDIETGKEIETEIVGMADHQKMKDI